MLSGQLQYEVCSCSNVFFSSIIDLGTNLRLPINEYIFRVYYKPINYLLISNLSLYSYLPPQTMGISSLTDYLMFAITQDDLGVDGTR